MSAGLAVHPTMKLRKAWLLVLLLALSQLLAAASAGDAQEGERVGGPELGGSSSRGLQTLLGPDRVLCSHPCGISDPGAANLQEFQCSAQSRAVGLISSHSRLGHGGTCRVPGSQLVSLPSLLRFE